MAARWPWTQWYHLRSPNTMHFAVATFRRKEREWNSSVVANHLDMAATVVGLYSNEMLPSIGSRHQHDRPPPCLAK
jgi:hypothetical protein